MGLPPIYLTPASDNRYTVPCIVVKETICRTISGYMSLHLTILLYFFQLRYVHSLSIRVLYRNLKVGALDDGKGTCYRGGFRGGPEVERAGCRS